LSVESRPKERPATFRAESVGGRITTLRRERALLPALGVVGLFAAAFLVRYWLSRRVVSPWIVSDEYVYSRAARDAAAAGVSGLFSGITTTFPGNYPRLIAPAWMLFDSPGTAYTFAKAINALLMTLGAGLVYLWSRRLLRRPYALAAAALTLLLPPLLYSSVLMTENAFFPAFILSVFAIAVALERPTVARQLLVFVPIGLTWLVRVQAVVLLGIIPLAVALKVVLDARKRAGGFRDAVRGLRAYAPWAAVYVVGGVAYVGYTAARGRELHSVLGGYYAVTTVDYSLRAAGEWITYHFGELMLLVAVIPASALIIVAGQAFRRGAQTTPAERAFFAVAIPALLIVPAQVGLYSSHFALRVEERNMFHVAPLVLIAFALWLQRGLPRPARLTAVAAVVPIALLLTLPLETLLNISLLSDTFSFIPFFNVAANPSGGFDAAQLILALGALAAGIAFAAVPRDVGRLLTPLAVGGALLVLSNSALGGISSYSKSFRVQSGAGDDVNWIDRRVGDDADVAALYMGAADPYRARSTLLHTWFWNESLNTVFKTVAVDLLSLPQHNASVLGDGVLAPNPPRAGAEYAVTDHHTVVAGTEIARTQEHVLYRAASPLRIVAQTEGVYADGWSGNSAVHTRYSAAGRRPGRVRVVLSRQGWKGPRNLPGNVKVEIGPFSLGPSGPVMADVTAARTGVLNGVAPRSFVLPAPAPPYRIQVTVDTFSPAEYGFSDPRQLGAQVSFEPLARRAR